MSTVTTISQYATIITPASVVAGVGYVIKLVGPARAAKVVAEVEKDAPIVEKAVAEVEQIPAVKKAVDEAEAKAKAEIEKANAASHGAIDVVVNALAAALPAAIQEAAAAAHASIPAPGAPAVPPVAADEPVTVVKQ